MKPLSALALAVFLLAATGCRNDDRAAPGVRTDTVGTPSGTIRGAPLENFDPGTAAAGTVRVSPPAPGPETKPAPTIPPPQVVPGPGEAIPAPLNPNTPQTQVNRPNPPSGLPQ